MPGTRPFASQLIESMELVDGVSVTMPAIVTILMGRHVANCEGTAPGMTRLAILADIHANLPALEAVRRDLDNERVDRVVVAGDSINWGPSSAEVVDIIQREGWAA